MPVLSATPCRSVALFLLFPAIASQIPGAAAENLRWERLKARCDADANGSISASEFAGSPAQFAGLDLDASGVIDAKEFAAATRSRRHDGAPQVGDPAPVLSATKPDGEVVDLSKPRRPTVLVFGSHT